MGESDLAEEGLVESLEEAGAVELELEAEPVPREWRGRVRELEAGPLQGLWAEAVMYARWEIGRYGRWRRQEEPVLASGYDAEGVVQAAFEALLSREAGGVPIFYSGEEIRRKLRSAIKHRVRWLHERRETRLVVGEWDVLPLDADGEPVSVFDGMAGQIRAPDEELMRKEKEQWLEEFKAGFEVGLGDGKEMLEVFRRVCDGQERREIATGMGTRVERVKTLLAGLARRLGRSEEAKRILDF